MPLSAPSLTVAELAARSGVAPSALRYYEALGLIRAERSAGNQRRYARGELRRVAVIRAARAMGVPLAQVVQALGALPTARQPNLADWERLSRRWHAELSERIAILERLRDNLGSCIGCGCLSLKRCRLFNPADEAAAGGDGARYLLAAPPARRGGRKPARG